MHNALLCIMQWYALCNVLQYTMLWIIQFCAKFNVKHYWILCKNQCYACIVMHDAYCIIHCWPPCLHCSAMHCCAMHRCAMHRCAMHHCAMHHCAMNRCAMHRCALQSCALQSCIFQWLKSCLNIYSRLRVNNVHSCFPRTPLNRWKWYLHGHETLKKNLLLATKKRFSEISY